MRKYSLLACSLLLAGGRCVDAADVPPVNLPAPVQTVKVKSEVRGKHPRVIVDAAGVEAFRQKIKDPTFGPMWERYLLTVEKTYKPAPPVARSEDEVRTVGNAAPQIAFAYLITHDPKYLELIRTWLRTVVAYPDWAKDVDLGASHMTFGMALVYDWAYDGLTPEERKLAEDALLRHGRLLLKRSTINVGSWWGYAYFQNHCWIDHTGPATAAMALYDLYPEEMQTWLDYTRTQFQTTYHDLGPDSSYHKGPSYMDYGVLWMLYYMEALRGISGEDLSDAPMLRNATRHILDTTMPDWRSTANFGDSLPVNYGPRDDAMLTWLASHQKDGHAEWLRQRSREAYHQNWFYSPFAMLWFDPAVKEKSPDDLPTVGVYPDRGLATFRTDWSSDAAMVTLLCGPPGGHHMVDGWSSFPHPALNTGHSHPDANSFLFWSDHEWRIGAPGEYTHDKKNHDENIWMANDKGQRGGDGNQWFEPESYYKPAGLPQAHLVRVASSTAADYVVGEAAPAYEFDLKVTSFRRHLLFVKGEKPYVVVYDRLQADGPVTWKGYLHTYGKIDLKPGQKFETEGGEPPPFPWETWRKPPALTPTFGVMVGPGTFELATHPLNVLGHPKNKMEDRGFELVVQPAAGAEKSTWLITVVGGQSREVKLVGDDKIPTVRVGNDTVSWDAQDNVSLSPFGRVEAPAFRRQL